MQFIPPRQAQDMGPWDELAGPFPTLSAVECFIDSPPDDLGDPGPVTVAKEGGWFYVFSLADERRVLARARGVA